MTIVIVLVAVAVGFLVHAIVTFVFARSNAGQLQTRGHELGLW